MRESCVCIAADVKNSRELDSTRLITSLQECVTLLNNSYSDNILIPFAIRNGDELVGVVKEFSLGYFSAIKMLDKLDENGIHLYIGVGLGELESKDATIHTMNGTAVISAFKARDQYLKSHHPEAKQWVVNEDKTTIFFYGENYPYQAFNSITYAILEKSYNRSEKQKEVIHLIQQDPSLSYEQIGRQMGYKSPKSTVSYLLTRANYHVVNAMENSIIQLLNDIQQRRPRGNN